MPARLGSRLAFELGRIGDVVLIDVDPHASGLAPDPARLDWTLQGDATLPDTLRAAGIEHAAELMAVTANDYVNAQIVTAAARTAARPRILIRLEETGLLRFFEERLGTATRRSARSAHMRWLLARCWSTRRRSATGTTTASRCCRRAMGARRTFCSQATIR